MKTIQWPIKRLFEICELMCRVPIIAIPGSVMGKGLTGIAKEFTSHLSASKMSSLLELGCGDGRLTIPLAKHGFHIVAVDLSQVALNRLMDRARKYGVQNRIEVRKKNFLNAIPSEKYDAVVCTDALHYFDKSAVLRILDYIEQVTSRKGYNYLRMFADIQRTKNGRSLTYDDAASCSSAETYQLLQQHYNKWDIIELKRTRYRTRWPPAYLNKAITGTRLQAWAYDMQAIAFEVVAQKRP